MAKPYDQIPDRRAIVRRRALEEALAKLVEDLPTGSEPPRPHVLALLNRSYEEIFNTLISEPELRSLLSPFMTAYHAKAFDQLEGQIGTLKIFISRLATKETFWVFSGDDFDLKISDKDNPGMLVLANDPNTQTVIPVRQ